MQVKPFVTALACEQLLPIAPDIHPGGWIGGAKIRAAEFYYSAFEIVLIFVKARISGSAESRNSPCPAWDEYPTPQRGPR